MKNSRKKQQGRPRGSRDVRTAIPYREGRREPKKAGMVLTWPEFRKLRTWVNTADRLAKEAARGKDPDAVAAYHRHLQGIPPA